MSFLVLMTQVLNECAVIESEIHKHGVGREQAYAADVLGTCVELSILTALPGSGGLFFKQLRI